MSVHITWSNKNGKLYLMQVLLTVIAVPDSRMKPITVQTKQIKQAKDYSTDHW